MALNKDIFKIYSNLSIPHYYLCNYKPYYLGADKLSKSLLNFKSLSEPDLKAWVNCAVEEFYKTVTLNDPIVIIRALGSNETFATESNSGLDFLGVKLSDRLKGFWRPEILIKQSTTPQKRLKLKEREKNLRDAYSVQIPANELDNTSVIILDDILTTGTTLLAIADAITRHSPKSKIFGFTLAKTDHEAVANKNIRLHSDEYNWENEAGWLVAEEDVNYCNNYEDLVRMILDDDFY